MQIRIHINAFTWDEWPLQEPASFNSFSIGEEQSASNVVTLSWSPPGLARNRRCVLTILTTNLILSFWASTSDPSVLASWERVYVVNTGVWQSSVRSNKLNCAPNPTPSFLRRLLRIRSVAWAPILHLKLDHDESRLKSGSGLYFLAVTNDNNSVLFLSVSSPYINESTSWGVRIVRQDNFEKERAESEHRPPYPHGSLLYAALETQPLIDRVSWAVWSQIENLAEIYVTLEKDNVSIGHTNFYVLPGFPSRTSFSKPTISSIASPFSHQIEHLDMTSMSLPCSSLRKQALQLRAKYDGENDYGGLSFIKSWGLATHKNYAAICISVHPGDMVDNVLASEERSTILFSICGTESLTKELETFPWEGDLNTIEITGTQSAIIQTIIDIEGKSGLETGRLSDRIIYATACASMLLWDTERPQRLSHGKVLLERLGRRINIGFDSEINACSQLLKNPGIDTDEAVAIVGEATGSRTEEELAVTANVFDVCSICARPVNWQSLFDATCSEGHHFGASSSARPRLTILC